MRHLARLLAIAAVVLAAVTATAPAPAKLPREGDVRFKTTCQLDHAAKDDPIVAPGVPGGAPHLHDFTGRRGVTAFTTTYSQLIAGTTTCNDALDKAAYWAPAVYINGVKVNPERMTAYYRLNGKHGPIEAYPPGLKVVAGHNMAKPSDPIGVTGWQCDESGPANPTPAGCTSDLTMRVNFPDCWNGRDLDSADHRRHLAYAVDTGPKHVCPSSHPVPLPALTTYWHYGSVPHGAVITLASGDVEHGVHADFFNGWDIARLDERIQTCLIDRQKCPSGG